jgi:hypothetical protein
MKATISFSCPNQGKITIEKIKAIPVHPSHPYSHSITYYKNISNPNDKGIYYSDINANIQYLNPQQVELITLTFLSHI